MYNENKIQQASKANYTALTPARKKHNKRTHHLNSRYSEKLNELTEHLNFTNYEIFHTSMTHSEKMKTLLCMNNGTCKSCMGAPR